MCGSILDRDYNDTINILKKGLEIFGMNHCPAWGPLEVTSVEIVMRSRKQKP
jgi:transposase